MVEMEAAAVKKIDAIWNMILKATSTEDAASQEKVVSSLIQSYFNDDTDSTKPSAPTKSSTNTQLLSVDVRAFMSKCGEQVKTPRQIARIFHGIPSPQFPAQIWYSNGLWGKRRQYDFNDIINIARQVIVSNHTVTKLPGKASAPPANASSSSSASSTAPKQTSENNDEILAASNASQTIESVRTPTKRPNPESSRSLRSLNPQSPSKPSK
jgi:hypothetical protein